MWHDIFKKNHGIPCIYVSGKQLELLDVKLAMFVNSILLAFKHKRRCMVSVKRLSCDLIHFARFTIITHFLLVFLKMSRETYKIKVLYECLIVL